MTAKATKPAKSGWCLCNDHDNCSWAACACGCHTGKEGD